MIIKVDNCNYKEIVDHFIQERGGEFNEDTRSEVSFVASSPSKGVFHLHLFPSPIWLGVQNASARMTNKGINFSDIQEAVRIGIEQFDEVYFCDISTQKLNLMKKLINKNK